MEMPGHIFSRRVPCPICSHTPLIFVSCGACDSTFAWCGEEDHAVGIYDGIDLRELGLGDTPEWAREGCPACKADSMIYSDREQVESLGFPPTEIYP
jgi:hypothetical protein